MMKRLYYLPFALVLIGVFSVAINSQNNSVDPKLPAAIAEIDRYLKQRESAGFSGAVLIAEKSKILLRKGYGFADDERKKRATSETGFDIGSLVKPFTTAAILKLESQGKLKTTDTLAKFFPQAPPDKAGITIQQLINHTAGLADIVNEDGTPIPENQFTAELDYKPMTREQVVRGALNSKLVSSSGEKFNYSNVGFSLLGVIVEIASGQSYEEYVRENLFKPAGMMKTGYVLPRWKKKDLAVGYRNGKRWGTPLDFKWMPDGRPSWILMANGGMISTVDDLYRWFKTLEGEKVLSQSAKEKFIRKNRQGERVARMVGSNGVYNAVYEWYADEGRMIIILTNKDKFTAFDIFQDISKRLLHSK